jgi:hypothetical protein
MEFRNFEESFDNRDTNDMPNTYELVKLKQDLTKKVTEEERIEAEKNKKYWENFDRSCDFNNLARLVERKRINDLRIKKGEDQRRKFPLDKDFDDKFCEQEKPPLLPQIPADNFHYFDIRDRMNLQFLAEKRKSWQQEHEFLQKKREKSPKKTEIFIQREEKVIENQEKYYMGTLDHSHWMKKDNIRKLYEEKNMKIPSKTIRWCEFNKETNEWLEKKRIEYEDGTFVTRYECPQKFFSVVKQRNIQIEKPHFIPKNHIKQGYCDWIINNEDSPEPDLTVPLVETRIVNVDGSIQDPILYRPSMGLNEYKLLTEDYAYPHLESTEHDEYLSYDINPFTGLFDYKYRKWDLLSKDSKLSIISHRRKIKEKNTYENFLIEIENFIFETKPIIKEDDFLNTLSNIQKEIDLLPKEKEKINKDQTNLKKQCKYCSKQISLLNKVHEKECGEVLKSFNLNENKIKEFSHFEKSSRLLTFMTKCNFCEKVVHNYSYKRHLFICDSQVLLPSKEICPKCLKEVRLSINHQDKEYKHQCSGKKVASHVCFKCNRIVNVIPHQCKMKSNVEKKKIQCLVCPKTFEPYLKLRHYRNCKTLKKYKAFVDYFFKDLPENNISEVLNSENFKEEYKKFTETFRQERNKIKNYELNNHFQRIRAIAIKKKTFRKFYNTVSELIELGYRFNTIRNYVSNGWSEFKKMDKKKYEKYYRQRLKMEFEKSSKEYLSKYAHNQAITDFNNQYPNIGNQIKECANKFIKMNNLKLELSDEDRRSPDIIYMTQLRIINNNWDEIENFINKEMNITNVLQYLNTLRNSINENYNTIYENILNVKFEHYFDLMKDEFEKEFINTPFYTTKIESFMNYNPHGSDYSTKASKEYKKQLRKIYKQNNQRVKNFKEAEEFDNKLHDLLKNHLNTFTFNLHNKKNNIVISKPVETKEYLNPTVIKETLKEFFQTPIKKNIFKSDKSSDKISNGSASTCGSDENSSIIANKNISKFETMEKSTPTKFDEKFTQKIGRYYMGNLFKTLK